MIVYFTISHHTQYLFLTKFSYSPFFLFFRPSLLSHSLLRLEIPLQFQLKKNQKKEELINHETYICCSFKLIASHVFAPLSRVLCLFLISLFITSSHSFQYPFYIDKNIIFWLSYRFLFLGFVYCGKLHPWEVHAVDFSEICIFLRGKKQCMLLLWSESFCVHWLYIFGLFLFRVLFRVLWLCIDLISCIILDLGCLTFDLAASSGHKNKILKMGRWTETSLALF